ncbi:hypothetical protein HZC27_03895 [Candidatus Roizmanbacteria bacterium]|nr:hypothetical protein [Candidatus Roizmanbacteria bacterium]
MKASTLRYKIKEKRFEVWQMKEKLFLNDGQALRLIWNEIRFIYDDFESYVFRGRENKKDDELKELSIYLLHLKRLSRSPFIILVWLLRGLTLMKSKLKLLRQENTLQREHASSTKHKRVSRMDIIICSDARFDERPRRATYIARALATRGHRVFFIEPRFITDSKRYAFEKRDENIYTVNLSASKEFDISFHKISKREVKKIRKSFHSFCQEVDFSKHTSVLIGHSFWRKILISCKYPKNIIPEDMGTDYNHFAPASVKTDTCAVGLCWIKQPVLGILEGSDGKIDPKLIDKIASVFSTASIVIEGRIESKKLIEIAKKHQNIFPVGEKSYSQLPKFLQTYDVCIMPYLKGIFKSDSQEMYDYLSAGKAVITSLKPVSTKIKKFVYVSKNEDEFILNIKKALKEKGKKQIKKRQLFAESQTWERRVKKLENILRRGFSMAK